MASEQYKCKEELSITDIEAEIKQNASGSHLGGIQDISNGEIIKEEALEVKPIREYEVSNECLVKNENVKDSPTQKRNFNCLVGELEKHKVNHFDNGVIVKNEDNSECIEDSLTSNIELEMGTPKTEDDIDIIYEDVKPEIFKKKASGKSENEPYQNSVNDILIGTKIGPEPNFSHELSKGSVEFFQQECIAFPELYKNISLVKTVSNTLNHIRGSIFTNYHNV